MKSKDQIIIEAKKIFAEKIHQNGKLGIIIDYDDFRIVFPTFKNIFGNTVIKVEATYHNALSKIDGKRVHVTVEI